LFTSGNGGIHRWPFRIQGDTLQIGPAKKLPVPGPTTNISLDGRGRILASINDLPDGSCWLLDLQNPTRAPRRLSHGSPAMVAISPDGRWVAAGTHNGFGVRVWDTDHPDRAWHLEPEERITRVALSPNGRWLAIGTRGGFSIWEVGSWRRVRTMSGEGGLVPSTMAFSHDSAALAVTISHSAVQLLDTKTWEPLARLQAPEAGPVSVCSFSPDGSQLAVTSEGDVRLWDLRLIRARLQEIGLDWPQPSYPPTPAYAEGALRVEVDLGELGDPPK
jgi:WD40 repeat protein